MTPEQLIASTNNIISLLQGAAANSATDIASRQQQRTPLARGAGAVGAPALNSYDYNRFYKPTIEPLVAQLEAAGRGYALNQALSDAMKKAANRYQSAYNAAASKASAGGGGTQTNPGTAQFYVDPNATPGQANPGGRLTENTTTLTSNPLSLPGTGRPQSESDLYKTLFGAGIGLVGGVPGAILGGLIGSQL